MQLQRAQRGQAAIRSQQTTTSCVTDSKQGPSTEQATKKPDQFEKGCGPADIPASQGACGKPNSCIDVRITTLVDKPTRSCSVTSDFASGSEGWTLTDIPKGSENGGFRFGEAGAPLEMQWSPRDGGALVSKDTTSSARFFTAPKAFLGDKKHYLGGELSFSMSASKVDRDNYNVVVLKGSNGKSLVANVPLPTADAKTTRVALDVSKTDFRIGHPDGEKATPSDLKSVLADLDALKLPADPFYGAREVVRLADVALTPPADGVPASEGGFKTSLTPGDYKLSNSPNPKADLRLLVLSENEVRVVEHEGSRFRAMKPVPGTDRLQCKVWVGKKGTPRRRKVTVWAEPCGKNAVRVGGEYFKDKTALVTSSDAMTTIQNADARRGGADVLVSEFATGTDGWRAIDFRGHSTGSGNPPEYKDELGELPLTWRSSTAKKADGEVSLKDTTGGKSSFLKAPAAYLGDKSAYAGGRLMVDMKSDKVNFDADAVVVLKGACGLTIVGDIGTPSAEDTRLVLDLDVDKASFFIDNKKSTPATDEQLRMVLSDIEAMYVPVEFSNRVDETTVVDRIELAPAPC